MINDLKPYPAMKDSSVPWLGEVPEHWDIEPLCAMARLKTIKGQNSRELLSVYLNLGVVPFDRIKEKRTNVTSEDLSGYQAVDPGDFVLNNQQAWRGSVGVSMHKGIVSPAYLVLSLHPRIDSRYANLLLRERSMVAQYLIASKGVGSIQRNLYWPHLKRIPIILPPLSEQAAIVRFLDHADRKIRRYIRAKQKLIKLLEEQKQAIIHRAVTRGLNPDVRLKPSGVEWLGEIPEHWEVVPVGAISILLQTGPFGSQLHQSDYISGGIPVINPSHMVDGRIKNDPDIGISSKKATALSRHTIKTDDILIARRGDLGRCALASSREDGWICGTGSMLLRCRKSILMPKFFQIIFASSGMAQELQLSSIGATMANLNEGVVARQRIPLPTLEDQTLIMGWIASQARAIEISISSIRNEIDLLHEYRIRLIADVVTGKLDVREAAAGFQEHLDAEELEASDYNEEDDDIESTSDLQEGDDT